MNRVTLSLSVVILLATSQTDAALNQRLFRRQSNEALEPESTTPSSNSASPQQTTKQPRLYPDLPRPPTVSFIPQFGNFRNPSSDNGPPPFIPIGAQMPNGGQFMNPSFRLPPQPRHMSPLERLQSQTFTNGLGRRLLSMMGINPPSSSNETTTANATSAHHDRMDETMRALQNSTVLRQLNSGVHSVYGSLSRMYNSTVQQQLDLLQERYKKMMANGTDPWQQRMAEQVPQYFRSLAMKVNEAQENLNRVWRQVAQAGNNTGGNVADGVTRQAQTMASSPFDPMMNDGPMYNGNGGFQTGGGFLNQLGHSFGFGMDPIDPNSQNPRQDLGTKLMEFWHNQVQPQMGMVRGQVMRIWRDLTSSGALRPGAMSGRGRGDMGKTNISTDVVDDVLKDVEVNEPEFKLLDSGASDQPGQAFAGGVMPQLHNGMVAMQRELNQLWNGLTNSIQGALNMMSAKRAQGGMNPINNNNPEMDPAENEISDKLKDLSKIQRDADVVYDTVQRQQQAQQQNASFADRFRNFFSSMDFGNMDQLGYRFGDSVSRFGNMIGDRWRS